MTDQPDRIPPPEPGIYESIPFGQYLSWDACSQSALKPMDKSAAHFKAAQERQKNTTALRVGSITDIMVFTPDIFQETFAVTPRTYEASDGSIKPWHGGAKFCKAWVEDADKMGKTVITAGEYGQAVILARAVRGHPAAKAILAEGKPQVSLVWLDPETALVCKARLDWLTSDCIADLKTTRAAGPRQYEFPREMLTYGYQIQAAFYVDGYLELTGAELPFHIIAAEKCRPDAVAVYRVEPPSIAAGRNVYKRALFNYKACVSTDTWPGYSDFVEPIDIPTYALREELGNEEEGESDGI